MAAKQKRQARSKNPGNFLLIYFGVCLIVALMTIFAMSVKATPRPVSEIVSDASRSLFRVACKQEAGEYTGTAWQPAGTLYIITAAHIVKDGCESVTLRQPYKDDISVNVVRFNASKDIAVLQTEEPLWTASILKINPSARLAPGDVLWALGYPLTSRRPVLVDGILSSVDLSLFPEVKGRRLTTTIDTLYGHSGSPVFNVNGDVIGMAVSSTTNAGGYLAFVTPAADLSNYIGAK